MSDPSPVESPRAPLDLLIEEVVESLFVNGSGQKADRLVLMVDSKPPRDLGGWCRAAIADRLRSRLEASSVATKARPDGWLDGEIELTAFALAHPDCDVRAVLRGFAAWMHSAPASPPGVDAEPETKNEI